VSNSRNRGRPPYPDVLTPAEWRTVDAVRHGMSNRQIAKRRRISLDGVKFHVRNVLAKLEVPDRRSLRLWPGVPRTSVLSKRRREMTAESLQLGTIGQILRVVRDIKQSEAWYRDVLRLPHLFTYGDLAFFDCGGVRLFLSLREDGGEPGEQQCIYFRVDDIQGAYTELQTRGVRFEGAPHMIFRHPSGMEEWMAFFRDPDGSLLAIMSQVAPEVRG
jgi:DNA-binding CsgD family transcriptional regulator/catechol 2,3-dioxygenase-like lactoylglutathione lyase family enzyme